MSDTSIYANNLGAQQAGQATRPMNAFDSLSDTVNSLRDVQKMAQALADRLTGNAAPAASGSAKLQEIGGGGLFDGLERQTSAIREIHAEIYASLSRIENRL